MLKQNVSRFITTLSDWYEGSAQLSSANLLLDAPYNSLFDLLSENGLIDHSCRPVDGIPLQHVLNVILLYVAMRKKF